MLEDVDLSLPERGALAVLGRNGVGKTTLLATIMGRTTMHAGRIEYRGEPIERLPTYARNRLGIGYVPQTREVFPSLSVEENLAVAAQPGRWTAERIYELFPRLAERREGLAPVIVKALLAAIERLLRDETLTVVLVEQHAKLALGVTQRALVLSRGRVIHDGPSAELAADPQRLAALVLAG